MGQEQSNLPSNNLVVQLHMQNYEKLTRLIEQKLSDQTFTIDKRINQMDDTLLHYAAFKRDKNQYNICYQKEHLLIARIRGILHLEMSLMTKKQNQCWRVNDNLMNHAKIIYNQSNYKRNIKNNIKNQYERQKEYKSIRRGFRGGLNQKKVKRNEEQKKSNDQNDDEFEVDSQQEEDEEIEDDGIQTSSHSSIDLQAYLEQRDQIPDSDDDEEDEDDNKQKQKKQAQTKQKQQKVSKKKQDDDDDEDSDDDDDDDLEGEDDDDDDEEDEDENHLKRNKKFNNNRRQKQ